jgi:hypothetical protein
LGSWLEYLKKNEQRYFTPALRDAGLPLDVEIGVYILSWLGPNNLFKDPNELRALLQETLDLIGQACPSLPIFLKPHPTMRPHEIVELEQILGAVPGCKTVITYLHPMMLGLRARFAIANLYSTTFSTFRFCGVPTVEYSDYAPHILQETAGGSLRPEFVSYFVNRNRPALKSTLARLASVPKALPAESSSSVPVELLRQLTGAQDHERGSGLIRVNEQIRVD